MRQGTRFDTGQRCMITGRKGADLLDCGDTNSLLLTKNKLQQLSLLCCCSWLEENEERGFDT
jgi:hypothetical protein